MPAPSTPASPPKKTKSECHSCHATVAWALLEGRLQPLDHLTEATGNVAIETELIATEGPARAVLVSGVATHWRRHIDSCPHAAQWRERWKKNAPRPFSKMKGKKTR